MQNTATDSTNLPQVGTAQAEDRLTIGKAAKHIGVSIDTLRRWEKKGVVTASRSPGGHRYFLKKDLENLFGQKYTRVAPTKRTPKEQVQVQDRIEVSEPERIEPALSEPIHPHQPTQEVAPQPVKPPEAKPIATSQQAIPAQDTPVTLPTTPYQSVSAVPAAGLEEKAKEIVKDKKAKKFPWGKALIIGLIIFGVVDVILLIVFLTSSRAPISPIP